MIQIVGTIVKTVCAVTLCGMSNKLERSNSGIAPLDLRELSYT